jgi:hypothetical protein
MKAFKEKSRHFVCAGSLCEGMQEGRRTKICFAPAPQAAGATGLCNAANVALTFSRTA